MNNILYRRLTKTELLYLSQCCTYKDNWKDLLTGQDDKDFRNIILMVHGNIFTDSNNIPLVYDLFITEAILMKHTNDERFLNSLGLTSKNNFSPMALYKRILQKLENKIKGKFVIDTDRVYNDLLKGKTFFCHVLKNGFPQFYDINKVVKYLKNNEEISNVNYFLDIPDDQKCEDITQMIVNKKVQCIFIVPENIKTNNMNVLIPDNIQILNG